MRNGVVHVQDIKLMPFGYFRHAGSQRHDIRRVLKERVTGHFHLVVIDSGRIRVEPDRVSIADEMYFMPAVRQFQTQFCRHNAAAAVRGITGDADPHGSSIG